MNHPPVPARIYSIDSFRIFLIFLVTATHCWFYDGREYVVPLARIVIPFFFMISGFFLYSDDRERVCRNIQRSLPKLIVLWVIGFILFVGDSLLRGWEQHDFSRFIPTLTTPVVWLLCCHQKIGFPLWFLVALIETQLAMMLIITRKWDQHPLLRRGWILPCLLILIGVVLNKYLCTRHPLFGDSNIQYPPLFFMGWPFLYLGYLTRQHQEVLLCWAKRHQSLLFTLALITFITTQIEGAYTPTTGDNYFSSLPLAYSLFLLLLLHPAAGGPTLARIGSRYTLWIYILHVLVYNNLHRLTGTYHHWSLHPFVVFPLTFALAILAERIASRTIFRKKTV